jgi:hypothetical protein
MYKTCLYYTAQHNGWCYHMSYVRNKKTDGVLCSKVSKKKYCPYHPKNKEKKNVYVRGK